MGFGARFERLLRSTGISFVGRLLSTTSSSNFLRFMDREVRRGFSEGREEEVVGVSSDVLILKREK